jgi:hypothetical protein
METYTHGEVRQIPIGEIKANPWNPNEMTAEEFNLLSENIDEVDFLDPLLVVPHDGKFRVIDGEHRYEAMILTDAEEIMCVIADPERIPEARQKFQTVRMNKIRGSLNQKKFAKLVSDIMNEGEYSFEELAHEFGFADEDEFTHMVEAARETLPTSEMKSEFDKAKKDIKTIDDLSDLLNRLFTKYGDTLPANFMVLDFGGKSHLWVRMRPGSYKNIRALARECLAAGYTFDSIIERVMMVLPLTKFIEKHSDFLKEVGPPAETTLQ